MSSYIDSSVFLRRYVREQVEAVPAPAPVDILGPTTCRITQVEVLRFLERSPSAVERSLGLALFAHELGQCDVVEVDEFLALRAAIFGGRYSVKSLDAIHLAAAERAACTTFVTGDRRQAAAARALGMAVTEC